jgi:metallo-beta-lactamase class B
MKILVTALLAIFLSAQTSGQTSKPGLTITHLTGDLYVYVTWHMNDGAPYPANAMYLVTSDGVVLFDTPWDSTQFQPLLDSIYARHQKKAVLCISTHFHADRTAGLEYYQQQGIATWSSARTLELCREHHEKQAANTFSRDTVFTVGNYSFRTFYPGEGHTKDNIVIWIPSGKVLYGGCFIKSTEATDPGYMGDGNAVAYPESLRRLIHAFPRPAYVIPGHLSWSDKRSPQHTLQLVETYLKEESTKNSSTQ